MTLNRNLALNVALGEYLSSHIDVETYEKATMEELEQMREDGDLIIWQPFEYWSLEDVIKQMESLASSVERVLELKDVEFENNR
jgi:hypothetical protein